MCIGAYIRKTLRIIIMLYFIHPTISIARQSISEKANPIQTIQDIYGYYAPSESHDTWHKADKKWDPSSFKHPHIGDLPLSNAFRKLIKKDEFTTPSGEMPCIDYDPISDSQDPDIDYFKISGIDDTQKNKLVLGIQIRGKSNKIVKITYVFTNEENKWGIDDIINYNNNFNDGRAFSVNNYLKKCLRRK